MFTYLLAIVLGVVTALYVKRVIDRDRKEGMLLAATLVILFIASFLPCKIDKVIPSWEKDEIPTCHVYVESDVDVSDWKHIGLTSTYTTIRGFIFSGDDNPVLVYDADEMSADEARVAYKNQK